eukprot:8244543-Lingulodinium_polyedra.AAC.1
MPYMRAPVQDVGACRRPLVEAPQERLLQGSLLLRKHLDLLEDLLQLRGPARRRQLDVLDGDLAPST